MKNRAGFLAAALAGIALASISTLGSAEEVQALVVDNGGCILGKGQPCFAVDDDNVGNGNGRMAGEVVCHRGITMVIPAAKAAGKHIAHGDTLGACEVEQSEE